jgi:hypothetical protein
MGASLTSNAKREDLNQIPQAQLGFGLVAGVAGTSGHRYIFSVNALARKKRMGRQKAESGQP